MRPAELIANSSIAAVVSDPRLPDNPIIECNDAFVALTGYLRDEIIGRNCRFLRGPETEPWLTEALRTAIVRRQPAMVEILNYRKDGRPFRNAVMVSPIFDDAGELAYYIGSQVELSGDDVRASDPRRRRAYDLIGQLSPRQREVLMEIAQGRLNKQIAHDLDLSERTVKMHRAALLDALGVRNTAEAIRIAVEAGY
ncbi:MAG TPA: LuxR C-terminal-related transcriptional regulator [Sphingomonadaceae bacterium]|nr:LuxR C-terminal-related transcriptional regulator [Sphingomonadaceae bacterium]